MRKIVSTKFVNTPGSYQSNEVKVTVPDKSANLEFKVGGSDLKDVNCFV